MNPFTPAQSTACANYIEVLLKTGRVPAANLARLRAEIAQFRAEARGERFSEAQAYLNGAPTGWQGAVA